MEDRVMYSGECVGGPMDGQQRVEARNPFQVAVHQPFTTVIVADGTLPETGPRFDVGEYYHMERGQQGEVVVGYWWYKGPGGPRSGGWY